MNNKIKIYIILCSFLFVQNIFSQELYTASTILSQAIKKNKAIVLGQTAELSEDKLDFLFSNYSIEDIFNANYAKFSIINLLAAGRNLSKNVKEIVISSNNGNQEIVLSESDIGQQKVLKQANTSKERDILQRPMLDDEKKRYLVVLDNKLMVRVKSKVNKKTFYHYPILENRAGFLISDEINRQDGVLTSDELREFISIYNLYKNKKLKVDAKAKYKTVFALNLIDKLFFTP
jgi:hypothetical protein